MYHDFDSSPPVDNVPRWRDLELPPLRDSWSREVAGAVRIARERAEVDIWRSIPWTSTSRVELEEGRADRGVFQRVFGYSRDYDLPPSPGHCPAVTNHTVFYYN